MRRDTRELRDSLNDWMDRLCELYDRHDPRNPSEEFDKTAEAYQAIEISWRIMDAAADWAQRHIIGIEYAKAYADQVEAWPHYEDLYDDDGGFDDSHRYLELLPLVEGEWASALPDSEHANSVCSQVINRELPALETDHRRAYISKLMTSCSAGSYGWRNELMHALLASNEGATCELFTPANRKAQGNSYETQIWKLQAVKYVLFLQGKGEKKYNALQQVADAVGRDVETIRDWEKKLKLDTEGNFELAVARVAGEFEDELKLKGAFASTYSSELKNKNLRYEFRDLIEYAAHYAMGATRHELSEIAKNLDSATRGQQISPRVT